MNKQPTIRPIEDRDREPLLIIARDLVDSADTYAFDADISDDALWTYWNPPQWGQGYVALLEECVAGMFVLKRNQPGPASHIANGSYAVSKDMRGRGIGKCMGVASLGLARDLGFRAMQFNIVLADNTAAVRAWLGLGFQIKGTIPNGFRKRDGSYVDFHIMYLEL